MEESLKKKKEGKRRRLMIIVLNLHRMDCAICKWENITSFNIYHRGLNENRGYWILHYYIKSI